MDLAKGRAAIVGAVGVNQPGRPARGNSMHEDDYVVATNLTKMRIVDNILRSISPGEEFGISFQSHRRLVANVGDIVGEIEKILEKKMD